MARLYRRTPITSITTASEKQDKRRANRNCRSALRRTLKQHADSDDIVLPTLRDVSNPWDMAKDGCAWLGRSFPELMRK